MDGFGKSGVVPAFHLHPSTCCEYREEYVILGNNWGMGD